MADGKTPKALLRTLLATLLLSCLLLPLAPVRAFDLDCANEASESVAVLSFCNGNGWRRTCLYGGGYATDGSGECTLVQSGALYCEDCQGNAHKLERCCDIVDLRVSDSGYELSAGQQANTYDIEWGIGLLQCPGNTGCATSGYPQCNGGGFDGINSWFGLDKYSYVQGYEFCPEFRGTILRGLEPRGDSSGGVKLRELERPWEESAAEADEIRAEPPRPIAPLGDGALAGGKTKMSRRLWGSGRPWPPPKMYSRRLWGSGRPWYLRSTEQQWVKIIVPQVCPSAAFSPTHSLSAASSHLQRQGAPFDCDFNQQLALSLPPKPFAAPDSLLSSLHTYSVSSSSPTHSIQGALVDCDFNQQLALALPPNPPNAPLSALHSCKAPSSTVISTSSSPSAFLFFAPSFVSPSLFSDLLPSPLAGKAPSLTGALFDCDFNQQLNLSLPPKPSTATNSPLAPPPPPPPRSVFDIQSLEELVDRPIATAAHCFGCTAGSGSSCTGAVV
ncbi:unnamed protein product [Closterium sp. NIES-65]|nr:unnamed protein product [Closterium sp. NIES-65]